MEVIIIHDAASGEPRAKTRCCYICVLQLAVVHGALSVLLTPLSWCSFHLTRDCVLPFSKVLKPGLHSHVRWAKNTYTKDKHAALPKRVGDPALIISFLLSVAISNWYLWRCRYKVQLKRHRLKNSLRVKLFTSQYSLETHMEGSSRRFQLKRKKKKHRQKEERRREKRKKELRKKTV